MQQHIRIKISDRLTQFNQDQQIKFKFKWNLKIILFLFIPSWCDCVVSSSYCCWWLFLINHHLHHQIFWKVLRFRMWVCVSVYPSPRSETAVNVLKREQEKKHSLVTRSNGMARCWSLIHSFNQLFLYIYSGGMVELIPLCDPKVKN